jgi:hypothetical protein
MKNLFKSLLFPIVYAISFICSFYLSIIFFIVLLFDEAINGRRNEILKEDFSAFVQKIYDLPGALFSPAEKEQIRWTE